MKKITTLGLVALIATMGACKKQESQPEYDIVNLNNNKITILGHGGLGISGLAQYPLDSYEGICMALTKGADGSEIDVQITKDSVLVAFHDPILEDRTNGVGEIWNMYWSQVKDLTYVKGPYTNYSVSSMDRIFSQVNPGDHTFTFDIKFNSPDQSPQNRDIFQRSLLDLIAKYQLEDNITVEATSEEFLLALQAKNSNIRLFIYADYDSAVAIAQRSGFAGITVRADAVSADQVKAAHDKGLMVAVFSINALNHDETIRKNVDIMQTDQVSDLVFRLHGQHESVWNSSPF